MNTIYRIGDNVYHWQFGKGQVIDITDVKYPVQVNFELWGKCFTLNGCHFEHEEPTLSFTPYDLIKGGFSQERPKPEIEKGTPIWVKDSNSVVWSFGQFDMFDEDGKVWVLSINRIGTIPYQEYSLENPLK